MGNVIIPAQLYTVVNYVTSALLWLSVLGALLTILTFTMFGDIRTYPIKLIMYLCAAIACAYATFFFAFEPFVIHSWLCWPVAMTVHYMLLANFAWSMCVAQNFYQMIVRRNRTSEELEKYYHLFSWLPPFFVVLAVAAISWGTGRELYGTRGSVCWIIEPITQFTTFFLPGLLTVSTNIILFFFIGREIHETLAGAPRTDRRERRKEFRVYISIFISIGLTWISGFLMSLFKNVAIIQVIFFLIFSFSTPLQGFLIFASYCANSKVFAKWAGFFGHCLPFCRKWEEMVSSTTSSGF